MIIRTDNGEEYKTFRKPVTFEKIDKRWYAVIQPRMAPVVKVAVKHIKEIKA